MVRTACTASSWAGRFPAVACKPRDRARRRPLPVPPVWAGVVTPRQKRRQRLHTRGAPSQQRRCAKRKWGRQRVRAGEQPFPGTRGAKVKGGSESPLAGHAGCRLHHSHWTHHIPRHDAKRGTPPLAANAAEDDFFVSFRAKAAYQERSSGRRTRRGGGAVLRSPPARLPFPRRSAHAAKRRGAPPRAPSDPPPGVQMKASQERKEVARVDGIPAVWSAWIVMAMGERPPPPPSSGARRRPGQTGQAHPRAGRGAGRSDGSAAARASWPRSAP